jgi:hypothetical protein
MPDEQQLLRDALKRAAATLAAADVPFALGGGYALWVHGAPEPVHDADFLVTEPDTERAVAALAEAGFRIDRPPEGWLFKAYADGGDRSALVDVLHGVCGQPVTPEHLAEAEQRQVLGVWMPVMVPMPIIQAKLLAMDEHYCDFGALLPVARAVREKLDWERLAHDTAGSPFAEAFLLLCTRLGVAPDGSA